MGSGDVGLFQANHGKTFICLKHCDDEYEGVLSYSSEDTGHENKATSLLERYLLAKVNN